MRESLWEAVARVARAAARDERLQLPRARLAPWALQQIGVRRRALAAQLARLAAAAQLAGRHDE